MDPPVRDRIEIWRGDITTLEVDAIVNAANTSLLGGGGVDGAIHRAAGPRLLDACIPLGGCDVGDAVITPGFDLPAAHVIHTVGPIFITGQGAERLLLRSAYRRAMELLIEHGLHTIAFPALSCGAFRYPPDQACPIAVDEVVRCLETHPSIERVTLVAFDPPIDAALRAALADRLPT